MYVRTHGVMFRGLFRNLVVVYLNLDYSPADLSIWFQVGKLVESCLGEVMETLGCKV